MTTEGKATKADMTREEREEVIREAENVLRREYYQEVRALAEQIAEETVEQYDKGQGLTGEALREWLLDHVHESIDGHEFVIYTWQAQEVVLFSENDGCAIQDFGADGVITDGAINWSVLAFGAMKADVIDDLGDLEPPFDVNNPEDYCRAAVESKGGQEDVQC